MHDQLELEVFRAGDYGAKGVWDEAALERLAADYDPALHEAPVTLDHAQAGPALGWVASVRRVGDRLIARLRGLNRRLLELIRRGAFRKRSIELYTALRETGRPYLRAVSFLGAAAPEVKGLTDPLPAGQAGPLFAETGDDAGAGDGVVLFDDCRPPAALPIEKPLENTEATVHPAPAPAGPQNPAWPAFAEIAANLREHGQWQPSWIDADLAAFYEALAALGTVQLSGDRTVAPALWFAEFLQALPPVVMLSEAAPAAFELHAPLAGIPTGAPVASASIALHRKALAWQAAHPGTPYGDALRRCAAAG